MATTQLHLASPEATERLAARLAHHLRPGDFVGLSGGLGSGKSLFARALIAERLSAVGRREEIPSPSFTLVQTYDLGGTEIWHADLYRLADPGELTELGLDDAMSEVICVVEWAERLGDGLPPRRLMIALDFDPADDAARSVQLHASGAGWDWLETAFATPAQALP